MPADDAHLAAMAASLGAIHHQLGQLLAEDRGAIDQIAVTNDEQQDILLGNTPGPGMRRLIVHRTGTGNDNLSVPTTGVRVLSATQGRLGLSICNTGTVGVILYLAQWPNSSPAQLNRITAGKPALYLAAGVGTWDGRGGNSLWCGSVGAVGIGGTGTLVVGEW